MAGGWRTVRVFISSTFRDMQAERDHLVRFVFPRLREELLKRRIHLVDVDLRWGVTSEEDALEVCRHIIDECRPRFVCILGGRYGWVPPGREHSITADEVRYGVLDCLGRHGYAYFYFREPGATAAMVEEKPGELRETAGRPNEVKLAALKEEIAKAGLDPFVYPARWDTKEKRLAGLDAFGERVYTDLLASVDDEFGTEIPAAPDEFTEESSAMEAFVEERLERYVTGSREPVFRELAGFAEADGEPNFVALTGAAGCGKSALLAKFYRDYAAAHADDLVIPHFIGVSPGSTNLRRTLRRLCHELDSAEAPPEDVKDLIQKFPDYLSRAAESRHVILILDALNQLDAADNAHSLYWLPRELPPNVRVIVSSLESAVLDNLRRRGKAVREIPLDLLSDADSKSIIEAFLERYNKRMSPDQVTALLSKPDAGNPLYLLAALEELRTLGTYEEITARISELPGEIQPLFLWLLKRLENDPGFRDTDGNRIGPSLVRDFVSYIGVSRYGLSHMELCELLAPGDEKVTPPVSPDAQGNVAALERLLRPYLMHRGEFVDFYHAQFRQAVDAEYLDEEEERLFSHRAVAGYFENRWRGGDVHALSELPYHEAHAGLADEFKSTLTDFEFLYAKTSRLGPQALIEDYDVAELSALAMPTDGLRPLHLIQGALRLSAHVLVRDTNQLPGQLTGRLLSIDEPGVKALVEHIGQWRGAPWLRPLTPSLTPAGGPLLRTLEGHTGPVTAVAVFDDGRRAISASHDSVNGKETLKVWDLAEGSEISTHEPPTIWVTTVTVFDDGRKAISASWDRTLKVWDLASGRELSTLEGHTYYAVNAVAVFDDGRKAISASGDKTLKVWDLQTGRNIGTFEGHTGPVRAVGVFDNRRKAISASGDKTLKVWDLQTGRDVRTLEGHNDVVTAVAVFDDGRRAISASWDKTLKVWDLASGRELSTLKGHTRTVNAVAVFDDGRKAISASDDYTLKVWDIDAGRELRTLRGHTSWVDAVAVFDKGRKAISASWDGTLKVWDLAAGQEPRARTGHTSEVTAVAVFDDGRRAISASWDKTLKVWDLDAGRELAALKGHTSWVKAVAVFDDGRRAISASADKTLRVWELQTGRDVRTLEGHTNSVTAVAVFDGGRRAISASWDKTLKVWDLATGCEVYTLKGHTSGVKTVAVLKDGRKAISTSWDESLKVWDLGSRRELHTLEQHVWRVIGAAVFDDGRKAISASRDGTLKVWDLASGRELGTVEGHTGIATAVAVFDDGRGAISPSWETHKVWDLTSGRELATLEGHTRIATAAAVFDHARKAISAAWGGIKVWDVQTGAVIAMFTGEDELTACAASRHGRTIVCGDNSGQMHFLRLEGVS